MFLAIAASTLTTVVVFLPMLFIPGVVGIMFGELAMGHNGDADGVAFYGRDIQSDALRQMDEGRATGREALARWMKTFYDTSERWFKRLEDRYSKALAWCLGHKKTVIIGFIAVFILSFFLFKFVGSEFIPEEDTGDIRITIEMALGTRVEESDKVAARVEDILEKECAGVECCRMYAAVSPDGGTGRVMGGASGSHVVVAGLKLVPKTQRKRSVSEVGQKIRQRDTEDSGALEGRCIHGQSHRQDDNRDGWKGDTGRGYRPFFRGYRYRRQ